MASNKNAKSSTKDALSLLSNPFVAGGVVAAGALSNFLGANRQSSFYNDLQGRITGASSPDRLDAIFRTLIQAESGTFNRISRGEQLGAQTSAERTRASFRRAGLSGVGESVAGGADISAFLKGQRARDVFRIELLKRAQDQQRLEVNSLMGLLNTPFGAVSPASAALSGAGTGIEALVNAKYAEQLAGRDDKGGTK